MVAYKRWSQSEVRLYTVLCSAVPRLAVVVIKEQIIATSINIIISSDTSSLQLLKTLFRQSQAEIDPPDSSQKCVYGSLKTKEKSRS